MTIAARVLRDLCLIGVGIIGVLVEGPPSINNFGIHGVLVYVWASMIGLGAVASLTGLILRSIATEIYGCSFVGGGFAVWAVAVTTQPGATWISLMLGLVYLSGTAGQLYRVGILSARRRVV